MRWAAIVVLAACGGKREDAAARPALGLVAEVRERATLVTGTRRFALRTTTWYVHEGGRLVEKPAIAAAIAREEHGVTDVFLGATPIVAGGEDHHETHVRIAEPRVLVPLDGLAAEVVVAGTREAWRYEHELRTQLAFVTGTTIEPAPPLERIGPESSEASPVSRRLCRHPRIVDLDATGTTVFALVTECSDEAPIRIVAYAPEPTETRLSSRQEIEPAVIAAPYVVGVSGSRLAVASLDGRIATSLEGVTRVVAAVVDDRGALWALAIDTRGHVLARDGARVELASPDAIALEPRALGLDDTLGVVVLAAGARESWLFAERPPPGPPVTISR